MARYAVEQLEVRQLLSATTPVDDHVNLPGPDATIVTIDPLTSTMHLEGHIGHFNDADVFRFDLSEAAVLTFDFGTVASGYVPSLELLNSNGVSLYYSHNGSPFIVAAGSWYLSVSGNPGFQTGDYSINVLVDNRTTDTPPDDHADYWGPEATHVILDRWTSTLTFEGFMNHVNDRDFFQFDLKYATQLNFHWNIPDGEFVGSITIFDVYGQEVVGSHPWSPVLSDSVSLAAGHWFVMISGNPGFQNGEYSINALVDHHTTDTPPDDHADIRGPEATHVILNPSNSTLTFEGIMNDIYDKDFFQFDLESAKQLTFQWNIPDGEPFGSITIFDVFGQKVADSHYWSPVLSDGVSLEAGHWFVMISGHPDFPNGDYEVTAIVDDVADLPVPEPEPHWLLPHIVPSPPGIIVHSTVVIQINLPIDSYEVQSIILPPAALPEDWNPSWTPVQAATGSTMWTDRIDTDVNELPGGVFHNDRILDSSIIQPEQPGPNRGWIRVPGSQSGSTSGSRWSAMPDSQATSIRFQQDSLAASLEMFWNTSDRQQLSSLLDDD